MPLSPQQVVALRTVNKLSDFVEKNLQSPIIVMTLATVAAAFDAKAGDNDDPMIKLSKTFVQTVDQLNALLVLMMAEGLRRTDDLKPEELKEYQEVLEVYARTQDEIVARKVV